MLLKDMEILRWFKKLVWIMQFGSLQLHWGSVQQHSEQSYMLDVLYSPGGSWKKLLLKGERTRKNEKKSGLYRSSSCGASGGRSILLV